MKDHVFLMRPEDEYMHKPDAVSNFNESVYMNSFDFRQRVGGWMRLGNRVNEGRAELSVCLYLPDGRIACQFQRPGIAHNDAFDAGGLSYDVIEPFKSMRMQYQGDVIVVDNPDDLREPQKLFANGPRLPAKVDFTHTASSPIHGGEPQDDVTPTMYGRGFSRGHFNQHGKVDGVIRVGDESWEIDGRGWRDHSWGPRYWQAIHYYRLFIGNFENGDGFMLLRITDDHGETRRLGVMLVDGDYEEITDLNVSTEWTDQQDPKRVQLGVATHKRRAIIDAEVLTLAPLRNRRPVEGEVLISRIAEGYSKFTWEGREGFGMTEYIERMIDGQPVGYPL